MIRSTQANIAVSSAIGLLHVQLKLKKEISFINFDYGIDHSNTINVLSLLIIFHFSSGKISILD